MKNKLTLALGSVATLAGAASGVAQDSSPLFKVGSVDVRPHAAYSLMYDDNIFLEHKTKKANLGNPGRDHDIVHTFTPGLRLNAGDVGQRQSAYFDANYQVAITRFMDNDGANAYDQNASVELGGKLNRFSLAAKQTLVQQSDANVANLAANGRVRRKTWVTNVDTDYEISDKTSASLDLAQTIGDYRGVAFSDTADRTASLWLDYQFLPKVKAGVGGTVGYLQVDGNATSHNPNSAYYQGKLRLDWQATEKVNIQANGGYEYRNIQDASAGDPSMFVFGLNAIWKAAERTSVQLGANRGRVASNALGGALNMQTAFTAALRQGLAENLTLTLEGGYSIAEYETSAALLNTPAAIRAGIRDDRYYFVKPALGYRFAERAQASVFYQYRRNESTALGNGNDFLNNQLGLEVSYRF